ncbi:hypothetical protein ACJX0J_040955, partial [Zea mays]
TAYSTSVFFLGYSFFVMLLCIFLCFSSSKPTGEGEEEEEEEEEEKKEKEVEKKEEEEEMNLYSCFACLYCIIKTIWCLNVIFYHHACYTVLFACLYCIIKTIWCLNVIFYHHVYSQLIHHKLPQWVLNKDGLLPRTGTEIVQNIQHMYIQHKSNIDIKPIQSSQHPILT